MQADAVPALARRVEGELHVPGLGEPVQAHRGRLLHPRRALRPRPVSDLRVAGTRAGRAARTHPPRPASRRERRTRCRRCRAPLGHRRRCCHSRGAAGGIGVARSALVDELDSFWHSRPGLADVHINPLAAEATDALLRLLGPVLVDVAGHNLVELLAPGIPCAGRAGRASRARMTDSLGDRDAPDPFGVGAARSRAIRVPQLQSAGVLHAAAGRRATKRPKIGLGVVARCVASAIATAGSGSRQAPSPLLAPYGIRPAPWVCGYVIAGPAQIGENANPRRCRRDPWR